MEHHRTPKDETHGVSGRKVGDMIPPDAHRKPLPEPGICVDCERPKSAYNKGLRCQACDLKRTRPSAD